MEFDVMQGTGIKRVRKILGKGDDLHALSGNLKQYREGYVVSEINANDEIVMLTNGLVLCACKALGDVNESLLRRIQIREAVKADDVDALRSDPEGQGNAVVISRAE